eukprot:s533_g16.t2
MGGAQSVDAENEESEPSERPEIDLSPEDVAKMSYGEFNAALDSACKEDDFAKYRALWEYIWVVRKDNQAFDEALLADGGIKHLKYAFRHSDSTWREAGVRVCRTFFHNQEAREKLVLLDFVGSMMVLTMPKEGLDLEDDGGHDGAEEFGFQLLAAETILEMADYPEFMPSLCSTSVLNFLCIALNQVPQAVETVTHTFVKISSDPQNLQVFLGGSVGDILESFFKSTSCNRPTNPAMQQQWALNISALAHCANSMGTMIKYDHACQVDLMTIGSIFTSKSDNLRLISELSRLFYWVCRKSQDLFATLVESAGGNMEGLDTLLYSLVVTWKQSVDLHQRLQEGSASGLEDFLIDDLERTEIQFGSEEFIHKKEYAEMRLCYMNCLLWVLLPQENLRWRLKDFGLKDLHFAVELRQPNLLQVILGTMRHLLDQEHAQQCHQLMQFFGEQLLIFLDLAISGKFPDSLLRLLLDAVSILSLQRDMQKLLATFNIYGKLNRCLQSQWRMSDFPPNSAGDFFRLLSFEGYVGVLSFFPVQWLRAAAQVSKGWHFVAQSRAAEYDASVTCESTDDLTTFIASLSHSKLVSAIRCDISKVAWQFSREEFQRCSREIFNRSTNLERERISHVTWKCDSLYFGQYHVYFLRGMFPKLKSFKLDIPPIRNDTDNYSLSNSTYYFANVTRVSVVAEHVKKKGPIFPVKLSLGVHPAASLWQAENVTAIYLDMDSEWLVRKYRDRNSNRDNRKIELAVLRVMSQVAVHPAHRLGFVAKDLEADEVYPPREEFEEQLEGWVKRKDEHCKTIASLLLNLFEEQKFQQQDPSRLETTLLSIFDWWQVNSTTSYEQDREVSEARTAISLPDRLKVAMMRAQEKQALTSMETMSSCAPYECVVALSLFSRLALEPKFKRLFYNHLEPLLACVCTGIAAEAREAAATLANLMWAPDLNQEQLVCWLKFDGSSCLTVDAANVLLPVRAGDPKPVAIGQGMYKSTWGVEFVSDSCLTFHPDGFKTYNVPALLTTASPQDTFMNTSQSPYQWYHEPNPRHFTISCWFFWPLCSDDGLKSREGGCQCVLLQSSPPEMLIQIFVHFDKDNPEGIWTLVDYERTKHAIKTPKLNPGWHLLTVVSSTTESPAQKYNGTKFFLDEWCKRLPKVWEVQESRLQAALLHYILNDFYNLGNDLSRGGRKPFGLIADFRIYARCLSDDEVRKLSRAENTDKHPDQIARRLAELDAATVLVQRLDVPDCAAECLRALGSLATLSTQRAKIFHVCGRQLLRLMTSPQPMVQRQAKRLLNNLS